MATQKSQQNQALPIKSPTSSNIKPVASLRPSQVSARAEKRMDASVRSTRSQLSQNRTCNESHSPSINSRSSEIYRFDAVANQKLIDDHKKKRLQEKYDDVMFYRKIYLEDNGFLEREKSEQKKKVQNFVEAREEVNKYRRKLQKDEKRCQKDEKKMLFDQFNDQSDLNRINQKMATTMKNHKAGMDEHLATVLHKKQRDRTVDKELSQETHNLIINDVWRKPHEQALKKYYGDNLERQINEKIADCREALRQEKANERTLMMATKAKGDELWLREQQNEAHKKHLFNVENGKALQGRIDQAHADYKIHKQDQAMIRKNAEIEDDIARNNNGRKWQAEQDVVNGLKQQMADNRAKIVNERMLDRMTPNTTLFIPQKIRRVRYAY